jgi:NhaP-type Na+/H+ or K+/H+ antiporter
MNEVIFGTGFGILLGPHVLDIFDPRSWTSITDILTREIMRIVLITGLFTIGVQLPNRYMAEHAKSLLIMVVPTMAFGWFVSAGERASVRTHPLSSHCSVAFIHVLFPKLDFLSSLVISACLTPTDPIISAAVIGQLAVHVHASVLIAHKRLLVL